MRRAEDAISPERKRGRRARPKLGPVIEFIDEVLESDRHDPHKQRHTAHRIWGRVRVEHPEHVVVHLAVRGETR